MVASECAAVFAALLAGRTIPAARAACRAFFDAAVGTAAFARGTGVTTVRAAAAACYDAAAAELVAYCHSAAFNFQGGGQG